jgi:hypothetical protein
MPRPDFCAAGRVAGRELGLGFGVSDALADGLAVADGLAGPEVAADADPVGVVPPVAGGEAGRVGLPVGDDDGVDEVVGVTVVAGADTAGDTEPEGMGVTVAACADAVDTPRTANVASIAAAPERLSPPTRLCTMPPPLPLWWPAHGAVRARRDRTDRRLRT